MSESESNALPNDDSFTLDPPGRIAVIGAGPLGLECALYGRFLGYDVIVIESSTIGSAWVESAADPLPMMPDRSLTPLAKNAIDAQSETGEPQSLPLTIGEWIERGLAQIASSDLLADRVHLHSDCVRIDQVAIEPDDETDVSTDEEDDYAFEEIPSDFQLTIRREGGETEFERVEAIVLAVGREHDIEIGFDLPTPYLFRIGAKSSSSDEQALVEGWREIVAIFASLAGRAELDLYRPRRL